MESDNKNKDSNKGKWDSIAQQRLFVTPIFSLESPEKRPKAEKVKKNKKAKKEEK